MRCRRADLFLPPSLTPQTAEVLDTFRAIAELKQTYAPESIRQYGHQRSHQRTKTFCTFSGLLVSGGVKVEAGDRTENDPGLQPVPLFESIEDLQMPQPSCAHLLVR